MAVRQLAGVVGGLVVECVHVLLCASELRQRDARLTRPMPVLALTLLVHRVDVPNAVRQRPVIAEREAAILIQLPAAVM